MKASDLDAGQNYHVLDAQSIGDYLAAIADLRTLLGGGPADWRIREVGDGNLNLVFIVEGPDGSLCVKQALPYVRAAGPSWPMSPERATFENHYYRAVGPHVGALVPRIHHYDPQMYCTVMERLTPHIILRQGLIGGRRYPQLARQLAEFAACATFFTSDFAVPFERKLSDMVLFAGNAALMRISVDLIFTDPYLASPRNRHTTPHLDSLAAELRADTALKVAAARFGHKFLCEAQALLHGDLHSGSVMVTPDDTRVIDPEFAFYGPIGFDLGAFLGNLLLSWYSQPGHATGGDDRRGQQDWLLDQVRVFWATFRNRFLDLWDGHAAGDAYPAALFQDSAGRAAVACARQSFMDSLFADMLGFAACKMIRRILGFAHVQDFEQIIDPALRARCESGALAMARKLLVHPERFVTIDDVTAAVSPTR